MSASPHPLDILEQALNAERQALLGQDTPALECAIQAKLEALGVIEQLQLGSEHEARVKALSDLNRANSVLLTRRRREVNWTLKQMGAIDESRAYRHDGSPNVKSSLRYFGAG